jgi:hypothetical protein
MPHADTVPCLDALYDEFEVIGPNRSHESDGSIGDTDHQDRSSNHNRDDVSGSKTPQTDSDGEPDIRAIDVTQKGPWINGFTMQQGVDLIVSRCRSGQENRLVEVIYNRHAWYKSNGWNRIDYTGSNPHDKHAHFGAKADSGTLENDRRPWGIAEKWGDDMPAIDEYFHGIYLAVTGDANATSAHRTWRNEFAAAVRFGEGLNFADQNGANMFPGRFDQVDADLTELKTSVAAIVPASGVITEEQIETMARLIAEDFAARLSSK